ncbi:MAG: hypothetical protein Sapg2KO_45580 [Saprospiraceae bacterium]
MKLKYLKTFWLILLAIAVITPNSYAQKHSPTSAHTSYTGLSMFGYQGWFGTPGDGGTNSWRHYQKSGRFEPGTASIEYWPDMRETDQDERYETAFIFDNGAPATVFSSVNPKTVNRHFQWMKEYGIDGAFMQRFGSDFGIRPTLNQVLRNGLEGAKNNGRAIALMYDLTGLSVKVNGVANEGKRNQEVDKIFNDWKEIVDDIGLTTGGDDQPYLYHNGKPLIALWGLGFNSRHGSDGYDVQYWEQLVDSLQNHPIYGGMSIMIGVPTRWRTGGGDCISGTEHDKMIALLKKIDIIQPWHTSRFGRNQMGSEFKSLVAQDVIWCNENGLDYTPTISPGIREKILNDNGYERFREGGYYFWDMARAAIMAGSEMLYLGMFDEIDEGTQYHKINNNPPFYSNRVGFTDYGDDPEDHYLWLAGEATRALRGEFMMGAAYRNRADTSNFASDIRFTDQETTYDMDLTNSPANRKVFYADPYKVPDGAPTIGTVRDSALFPNELTSKVTFPEQQRGLYIRFIEVDATTDTVIAYLSAIAANSFTTIPYATSFESGQIDAKYWTTNTESGEGIVTVTNQYEPQTGTYHLAFGNANDQTPSTNSAELYLNLEDIIKDVILSFSLKSFDTVAHPQDGIYLSNDAGENFSKVFDFQDIPGVYTDYSLNLSELTETADLTFTDQFVIRFQHRASQTVEQGGITLDDVKVLFSDEKSGFAQFVATDEDTQGAWMGQYGVDGYYIVGKQPKLPAYASVSWGPDSKVAIWENKSTDVRGLQYTADSTILAARYADTSDHPWFFSIDVGTQESNVSIYFLDDNQDRSFIVSAIDGATGDRYDVQTVQNFENGYWLTWKITGKVKFVMELLGDSSAVVSGIFFSPSSPTNIEVADFLTFDGVDDFVDVGRDESLQVKGNEITLEAWFKINEAKASTFQSTILAMDHSETGNDLGYFVRANGNGQIEWGFGDGQWHEVKSEDGVQLFELGTWNHVAGVYDGLLQKIYLNGNLVATSDTFTTTIGIAPTENLLVGTSPAFLDRVINGGVAEVRIWNTARTDSEIKEFATQRITGQEIGLVGYWPIDEGEGQIIADRGANNNEGILGGTTEDSSTDPIWTEGQVSVPMIDILAGFNGSFEEDLDFWRFYEVPNSLGSTVEIITGDVVHGAKAVKVTYAPPTESLVDRSLDLWDSRMPLEPGVEYFGSFWTKKGPSTEGTLNFTYGFFDGERNVLAESDSIYEISNKYQKYKFHFIAPENTEMGWLAFRWKSGDGDDFLPGIMYLDQVQLLTEDRAVSVNDFPIVKREKVQLLPSYPNPFNQSTTIRYNLEEKAVVQLRIFNSYGQEVTQLINQEVPAGSYKIDWIPQNLPNGIYIVGLKAGSVLLSNRLILLR